MRSDWEFGPWKYDIVKKWATEITGAFTNESTRILALFGHLYFYLMEWDNLTDQYKPSPVQADAGLTLNDIIADFNSLYRKRLVAFPRYFNSDEGNQESYDDMKAKFTMVLDLNYYKYKKLIEQMGFFYDPLTTEKSHEKRDDDTEYKGKRKNAHTIDDMTHANLVEIQGALDMDGTGTNLDTSDLEHISIDLEFDGAPTVGTNSTTLSDNRQGQLVNAQQDGTYQIATGDAVRASSYSGPYNGTNSPDGHTDAILDNTSLAEGTTAGLTHSDVSQDLRIYGHASIGNPSAIGYSDEETFTNRKDEKDITTDKEGFNGDYADTIEKQRNLVRFSVLREFFEDLKKEILLSTWR